MYWPCCNAYAIHAQWCQWIPIRIMVCVDIHECAWISSDIHGCPAYLQTSMDVSEYLLCHGIISRRFWSKWEEEPCKNWESRAQSNIYVSHQPPGRYRYTQIRWYPLYFSNVHGCPLVSVDINGPMYIRGCPWMSKDMKRKLWKQNLCWISN